MREKIKIRSYIVITAIMLDAVVLGALLFIKISTDRLLVVVALTMMLLIFVGEKLFLHSRSTSQE